MNFFLFLSFFIDPPGLAAAQRVAIKEASQLVTWSTRHSPKSYDELTGGWNTVLYFGGSVVGKDLAHPSPNFHTGSKSAKFGVI